MADQGEQNLRRSQRQNFGVPPAFYPNNSVRPPGVSFLSALASTPARPRPELSSTVLPRMMQSDSTPVGFENSRDTTLVNNQTVNFADMSTINNETVPGVTNMEALIQSLAEIVTNTVMERVETRLNQQNQPPINIVTQSVPAATVPSQVPVILPSGTAHSATITTTLSIPVHMSTVPLVVPQVTSYTSASSRVPARTQVTASISQPTMSPHEQIDQPLPVQTQQPTLMLRKLLDLPEFSGQPEHWPRFITAYNETTAMYQYTTLENHSRLLKAVTGEARDTVEGLLVHPQNIGDVIQTLQFRFGRPVLLVRSQTEKIKSIKELKDDDFRGLINYATKVKNMVALFLAAGVDNHLSDPTLMEELVKRLPGLRKVEWARKAFTLDREPTICDFQCWLDETAHVIAIVDPQSSMPQKSTKGQRVMLATNETDYKGAVADPVSNQNPQPCPCCQGSHPTITCEKFKGMTLEDKWKFVRESHVCFSCVQKGHQVRSCPRNERCSVGGCRFYHHPILHGLEPTPRKPTVKPIESKIQPSLGIGGSEKVAFRVLPVILSGPKAVIPVYALIDEGSAVSLMEASLVDELGLEGEEDILNLQWYDDRVTREEAVVVSCQIQGATGSSAFRLEDVKAVKNLSLPCQSLDLAKLKQQFPQLSKIPLHAYDNIKPRILIGLNNARLTVTKTVVECGTNGPIAAETPLGWILYGPTDCTNDKNQPILMLHQSSREDQRKETMTQIKKQMDEFFQLEGFGLSVEPVVVESVENQRARKLLAQTKVMVNNRFQTGLLWRSDDVALPDNFRSALGRLEKLQQKLQRNPDEFKEYEQALRQYEVKGYARRLKDEEVSCRHLRTWYLPHFGVKHPGKNSIRIVFDCAAKTHEQSLNSNLIAGPDLNQSLFKVLSQFREFPIAVQGDIQEMFCQIQIIPDDRHSQRYLWRSSPNSTIEVYEMMSMLFGAAPSPCSALYVMQTNSDRFKDQYPVASAAIKNDQYIDDYLKSFKTIDEAVTVTLQVKKIHANGGFNLRRLVSNSPEVHRQLSEVNSESPLNMNLTQGEQREKVLGMYWDRLTDEFLFDFKFHRVPDEVRNGTRPPTKRELLSLVMSVFDPFGFLANITIAAKLILQETWSDAIEWDDVLPTKLNEQLQSWLECMTNLSDFRVPRCHVYIAQWIKFELHIFTDASDKAISVVAYFRIFTSNGIIVSFVCGKTRCAPKKPMTTPRLELQAALLGSRIKIAIIKEHSIKPNKVVMWTDSKTVILWIRSEARNYRPFVMHRIAEVLSNTEVGSWHWVPTALNPADDGTRPNTKLRADSMARWITGPEFLRNEQFDWNEDLDDLNKWEQPEEVRKNPVAILLLTKKEWLLNYMKFSSYSRLVRSLAYVLRACKTFKALRTFATTFPTLKYPVPSKFLKVDEVNFAEQVLCKQIQQEGFSKEYSQLLKEKYVDKTSVIYNVDPFMDKNGLIRCGGRIDAADFVPYYTRYPIVLPKGHIVTDLIITHFHAECQHMFNETVISKIRQRFWVPHLRVELNRIRRNCQHCKVKNAHPSQPQMGQLPAFRLEPSLPPFSNTGLDFFGPIVITVGRRNEKRWIALFTCLNIRAIHLEIAHDYSTDALILCIRNFINLRGKPRLMASDRGTNFIGFGGEISNVPTFFDTGRIEEAFAPPTYNIDWRFNVPKDPSAGGTWERLIQSVKRTLTAILKDRHPKEHVLRSALYEAMNIVNSRPLTDVPVNPEDETPLTPNHFLIGHTNSTQSPAPENVKEIWGRKMWRQSQQLKNHFWRRWLNEYLPTLTRRSKWHEKAKPLAIDDLVFICDPDAPRNDWKRGKIVKVFPGKDGQVRSAIVKTNNGEYHRPAHKLAVLDVCSSRSHGGGDVVIRPL